LAENSVQDHLNDKKQDTLGLERINEEQLGPCTLDAYLLFQDLCLLTISDHARFLSLDSISRTFGLELIESLLTDHFYLFKQVRESARAPTGDL
jgi:Guanine nucleotide exchange factor in Golgi transport N-terminal